MPESSFLAVNKPRTFLANSDSLQKVKQRLAAGDSFWQKSLNQLVQAADTKLTTPLQSVTYKKLVPPSGDAHDYLSLAPYWWPNPDTVDGLPYVNRDGEVNPERWQYDVTPLEEMTQAVRPLTFAYFFTKDERCAIRAAELMRTWFIDPATRMNPNLEFAQFVPGLPAEKDDGHGIIETVRFRWLIDGVSLLASSAAWTPVDQTALHEWFRQYQQWLLTSRMGQNLSQLADNKGSWYDMQVALYSLFIGDASTARRAVENAQQRIAAQIEPDGRQPAELKRTRSFHYSMYALQALFDVAYLGKHVGVDLFRFTTADGRSIRQALDFMIPFAIGEKKWPYLQIDEVRWYIMAELLRRAAVQFKEPRYEEALRQLPHGFSKGLDTSSIGGWFDVIEPPLMNV